LNAGSLGALRVASLLALLVLLTSEAGVAGQRWNEQTVAEVRTRLKEPRLDVPGAPPEVYRVIWVPTFAHPTSVTLEPQGKAWILVTSRLSGAGGYELGELKSRKTRRVTERDVVALRQLVTEVGLRQAPRLAEEDLCLDGTIYSYEIVSEGAYHSWIRFCPKLPPSDRYLEFGRAMLKLAQIKESDVE
jgi:hypothetical protein